jgi:transcriptional regulator with XRE-family HTH domain
VSFVAEGELQRNVGKNLAAYRSARGLSQEAFAEELGYHRTYVGGLERGERNLSLKAVERLAEALGIAPLDLLKSSRRRG